MNPSDDPVPAVLVATDFSDHARAAYAAGVELARRLGAPLRVLHVVDARSVLEQPGAAQWLARVGLAEEQMATRTGVPWLEILQLSDDFPTEVVVVGSKGLSASSIQVPGTTTLALLRYSRVPVLVVTGTHPEPAPRPTTRDSASAEAERA